MASDQVVPGPAAEAAQPGRPGAEELAVTAAPAPPSALDWLADRVVLFRAGDLIFVSYGLAGGVGALLALSWLTVLLLGLGYANLEVAGLILGGTVGALLLARLAALALDYRQLVRRPRETLLSATFTAWGGILAIAAACLVFSAVTGHRLLPLLDAVARAAPLGHAVGRLGCLTYGCCFGRPTRWPLAITYRDPRAKAVRTAGLRDVPLHPSPLYEAVWNVAIFALLNALPALGAPLGVPTATYLLAYGLGRFAIEFTRDNRHRRLVGPMAVNHLLALGLAVSGAISMAVVLAFQAAAADISLNQGLRQTARLLPVPALSSLVLLLGLALQRGSVGRW